MTTPLPLIWQYPVCTSMEHPTQLSPLVWHIYIHIDQLFHSVYNLSMCRKILKIWVCDCEFPMFKWETVETVKADDMWHAILEKAASHGGLQCTTSSSSSCSCISFFIECFEFINTHSLLHFVMFFFFFSITFFLRVESVTLNGPNK